MPNKNYKILKCNHGEKFMKASFVVYANLECLLKNTSTCENNPKKYYTEKEVQAYTLWLFVIYTVFIWCNKE